MRRETEEDLKHRRDEVARLERRITETEADLRDRGQRMDGRTAELKEREDKLTFVREQLEKATEQHKAQLERIAGMTSTGSGPARRAGGRRGQARRDGAGARDRAASARGGRGAREDRDDAIQRVASEQTAESSVSVFTLPQRGHEGPDHRQGGPEHPCVRGDDRGEHHHRRHAGGRRALVLRPRPARSRADDAGEARPGRPDPAGPDRRGARPIGPRPRGADPQGREDAVAETGLTDVHPELIKPSDGSSTGRATARTS